MKSLSLKALIVDDEPDARNILSLLLKEYFPLIEIDEPVDGVDAAVKAICRNQPDLLFLDIEMPDGSGFELLERFPNRRFTVIFVTAHDHYAIQAIRSAAFDYLLKPINRQSFCDAVNKALQPSPKEPPTPPPTLSVPLRKVGLPSLTGMDYVDVDTISRCEADGNYTQVFFTNGARETVSRTLLQFEQELLPFGFFRIHHKHLINLHLIQSYEKGKGGGFITLQNQTTLEVSARKKASLMRLLGHREG